METNNQIESIFLQANPAEIIAGIHWYKQAREVARDIAEYCNCSISTSAAMIAVLSPRCKWSVNLTYAWKVAHSYKDHSPIVYEGMRPLQANINKAIRILATNDISILSGPKVVSFYDNILYPESYEVTIDSWAYRAYLGMIGTGNDEIQYAITPKRYRIAAENYQTLAYKYNLAPCQFQAVVWIVSHRIEGKE